MYFTWFHCPRLFTRAIYLEPWLRDVHTLLPSRVKLGAAYVVFPLSSHCIWQFFKPHPNWCRTSNICENLHPFPTTIWFLFFESSLITHPRGRIRPDEFHLEKPNFSKETSVKPSTSRDTKPANLFMDPGNPWIHGWNVHRLSLLLVSSWFGTPHLSQWFESRVCQLANPCWIITKFQA